MYLLLVLLVICPSILWSISVILKISHILFIVQPLVLILRILLFVGKDFKSATSTKSSFLPSLNPRSWGKLGSLNVDKAILTKVSIIFQLSFTFLFLYAILTSISQFESALFQKYSSHDQLSLSDIVSNIPLYNILLYIKS